MRTIPLRRVFRIVNGGTPTSDDANWGGDVSWATPVDLARYNGGRLSSTDRTLTTEGLKSGSRTVRTGSLIVSTRAPIGYVAETATTMAFNQGCRGLEPLSDIDIRFFRYQLGALAEWLQSRGSGSTFLELSTEALAETQVSSPPLAEQRAIADYLDAETSRIDALIAKKQQLVDLIDERWIAHRNFAILRGVDPISGAGPLPQGWTRPQLGVTIELQRGHDLPADERRDGPYPIVSSGGVSGFHESFACRGPAVVTGRYGTVGEVYYMECECWPLNTTLYVKDFRGNDPRWVAFMLESLPLEAESEKSAVGGINRNVIGKLRVPRPSPADQKAIAATLVESKTRHDKARAVMTRQIALLAEHRQALITGAVTGEFALPAVG